MESLTRFDNVKVSLNYVYREIYEISIENNSSIDE